MMKVKKVLTTLALTALTMTMLPSNSLADPGVATARLSGSDRVETAVAVTDSGWTTADKVILAPSSDDNLVDALAAAPLAGKDSPILLTDNNNLTAVTKEELIKLQVKTVYVVGAINQSVVKQIKAIGGIRTVVLKGKDRIGTAAAISAKLVKPAGSFVVGYGALADALSVASYAAANNYSILVANPDGTLPKSEAKYKGSNVYLIGGSTLVADIPGAVRLFGNDRFATNQAIIKALTYKYDKAYIANGTDSHLVDSLVASSLAAKDNAPIILGSADSAAILAADDVHAKLSTTSTVTALGGASVVPDSNVQQITGGPLINPTPSSPTDSTASPASSNPSDSLDVISVTGRVVGAGVPDSAAETSISDERFGFSENIVLTAKDSSGNPMANQTLYLGANLPGLWITQVNGVTLTGSVNIGTAKVPLIQTENAPVPLFRKTSNIPAYDSVAIPGITVNNITQTPVIALQTGADGTISLTLADGNVPYLAVSTDDKKVNSYILDKGRTIKDQTLNLYFDSAETVKIGSMAVNWINTNKPGNPDHQLFPVTGVTINSPTVALTAGGATYPLVAVISPINATISNVTWSTSNGGVATVSSKGEVTPVGEGTATITVTTQSGVYKAASAVTVAPKGDVPVTGLTLDKSTLDITSIGSSRRITATLTPITAKNTMILWSTSNSVVATVKAGVVTSVGAGTATITATTQDGGYTATCFVTVKSSKTLVGGITLSEDIISLKAGGTPKTITAKILPSNATNKTLNWVTSDASVATVDNGVITPLKVGVAKITVTTLDGGKEASCTVVVIQ